jgi:peptidyl-prolyl cis-trans isomerase SurA
MKGAPVLKRLILAATLAMAAPVQAQDNLFSPVLLIGDRAITGWELEQRAQFLRLLRAPGDPVSQAREALIDDKLRLIEAERFDITLTEEQLTAGLTEFAARANLTAEQFTEALAQGGVEAETFRDFVAAGLLWREIVRGRYLGQVRISEAEVDRAIGRSAREVAIRLLLSEIVLPAPPGQEAAALDRATEIRAGIGSEGDFAAAARRFSASPSAGAGGRIDWLPLENLPGQLAGLILPLEPGQVSEPVQVPNAVVLFQLRQIEETVGPPAQGVQVEWAEYVVPNDADAEARVAEIAASVDRCTDLYGQPGVEAEAVLRVQEAPVDAVPANIAVALAGLDPGEVTSIVDGPARVVLMLCQRSALPPPVDPEVALTEAGDGAPEAGTPPAAATEPDRSEIREQLLNQKLAALADRDLGRLRAETWIREP